MELKLFGPVHVQEVPCVTDKFRVLPEQRGVLPEAAGVGNTFTETEVLVTDEHPFPSVTVTVYVPDASVVILDNDGFWLVEEKLSGPAQFHETPCVTDKVSVFPAQTGVLLEPTGIGKAFTTTDDVVTEEHPFASVTVTV